MDVEGEETQKAVVERAQGRVGTAFARLDLEEPDTDVDCQTEGPAMGDVVVGGELGKGDAFAGSDLLEDTMDAHDGYDVADYIRESCGVLVLSYHVVGESDVQSWRPFAVKPRSLFESAPVYYR